MANPSWIKKYLKMKPEVATIFETLEHYREFCVHFGFVFNEAHLGNEKSPWGDYQRALKGKDPKDQWHFAIEQGKRNF